MKKKAVLLLLMTAVIFSVASCMGTSENTNPENNTEIASEDISEQESITEENEEEGLTFEDLSKYSYYFSSGAGGWGEEFVIERDGYFKGSFHDSDMGDTGEGYPNGTVYSSSYTGYFTDLKQIDEYSYEMKLKEISYEDVSGEEELIRDVRYIYTDSYCLGGNDTFKIYLPGTPLSTFSEDVQMWIMYANNNDTELTIPIIVDEKNQYGICTTERLSALEDATMNYEHYKESYDYYCELATEANTTLDMKMNAQIRYEIADECLNYLWHLVRYNVEEDEFDKILEEQRTWIKDKEAQAQAEMDEWQGGSFAPVAYADTLAELTMERCEVLLEYLK